MERREIAKGVLFVVFDLLGQNVTFTAGQFFSLTLLTPPYSDNRGNSRFLGIVNSPSEKGRLSIVTKIGVSAFKKSLAELPLGTEVEIGGIDGHIHLPEDASQKIVFFAGGVGIAPIMSIIRLSNEQSWPHVIRLVYVNDDKTSTAFWDELTSYAKDNERFTLIPVMTQDSEWQGEKRGIDAQFVKEHFPNSEENLYFITGEPKFAPTVFRSLTEAGVSPQKLTMEIFTGY